MSDRRLELTRRGLLGTGLAAGLLSMGQLADAAEIGKLNLADYEKIEPQKFPWGWIRWLMNDQIETGAEMTLGIVYIEPRQSNPVHIHPNSAEILHVLSGACEHIIGQRVDKLKAGDTIRIPQGAPHHARTADDHCLSVIVYNTGKRQMVPVDEKKAKGQ